MSQRKSNKQPTFEEKLVKLEAIVLEMDNEDIPLEKAMALYEEGIKLRSDLVKWLGEAQEKIEILSRQANGEMQAQPFEENTP